MDHRYAPLPAHRMDAGTTFQQPLLPEPKPEERRYRVISVDDGADAGIGRIVVHHMLDVTAVDRIGQRAATAAVVFVVTAVDLAAGTYTLNYNDPVKGRNLIFEVTMVAITRVV